MNILMLLSKEFMVDPRVYKEAKTLVDAGHQVKVIMWNRHNTSKETCYENIEIIRIDNTFFMNLLPNDILRNYFWWRLAYKKGIEIFNTGYKFDVVHCHDLDTLQAGVWLKKKLNIQIIYDAHEIFAYMIEDEVPQIVTNYAFNMEKKLLPHVSQIITVDDGYANYFKKITNKPITIVRNCKQLIGDYEPPSHKRFTLVYIGILIKIRFFPEILHVIGKINNVELIIGAKKEGIYAEVEEISKQYNNITFLGPVPASKVIPITKECHAIVCLFDPTKNMNKIGSPNKLFEAMITGRPIIVTKGTHVGDIVEKEHCGIAIGYSENELIEAIQKLRDSPALCQELGQNGLRAAQREYNWANQQKELLNMYSTIK